MDFVLNKQKFLEIARHEISDFNEKLISHAWDFAEESHVGQRRRSGEAYFSHPVGVARILLDIECDSSTIAAALLHDIVEHTEVKIAEIDLKFGNKIASLVDGVTKLAQLDDVPNKIWTGEDVRRESLRKLFASIVDDPRVALIKLADRLHNLTTLGALPEDRRQKIAKESLDIFAPLAEALGLGVLQSRIQDISFRYFAPETYEELTRKVEERRAQFEEAKSDTVVMLENALEEAGIDAEVYGRQKGIYSIFRKMMEDDVEFEYVYDIVGIRIITKSEEDCYRVKYVVDQKGEEVRYADYISGPRGPLGYQSLHKITLNASGSTQVEVQIRSHEMHERAERGVAVHWYNKLQDSSSPDPDLVKRIHRLRDTLEALENAVANLSDDWAPVSIDEFIEVIREDGLATRIRVFTPKGDAVSLPKGSTPIDFAYYVHTDLGHDCFGAKINSKTEGLDRELLDRDTVEIIRQRGYGPEINWLTDGMVKTSSARQKIRQYFSEQGLPQAIAHGRRIVQETLKSHRSLKIKVNDLIAACSRANTLNDVSIERFYVAVALRRISSERLNRVIGQVIIEACIGKQGFSKDIIPDVVKWFWEANLIPIKREDSLFLLVAEGKVPTNLLDKAVNEVTTKTSADSGANDSQSSALGRLATRQLLEHLAKCCYPVRGDQIVQYATIGRGFSIHRAECLKILSIRDPRRVLPTDWESLDFSSDARFSGELIVRLSGSDSETYRKIQEVVSKAKGIVREQTQLGNSKWGDSQIRLLVDVKNIRHLQVIQERLRQISKIRNVSRVGTP